MKKWLSSLSLTILTLTSLNSVNIPTVNAANSFSQQEINQDQVIAIAAPINYGKAYQLLILEQISNTRDCWREQPGEPALVDMLLLNFDFTGICGRSVDTNGYSVRVGGEDLGWTYDLRVVKRANDLKLMAFPTRDVNSPAFEVGRTKGVPANGFAKIVLNPGWRLTKRVYNGKTIDHFYVTNDQDFATLAANFSLESVKESNSQVSTVPVAVTPPRNQPNNYTNFRGSNNMSYSNSNNTRYTNSNRNSNSNSNSNSNQYQAIEVIAPDPNAAPVVAPSDILRTPKVPKASASVPASASTLPPPPDVNYATTPSTSTSTIPNNAVASNSDWIEFTASAAPPAYNSANFQYRVIVNTNNPGQQNALKSVVPDAFRTKVNGQTVMQAGAFVEKPEADQLVELLQNNGLSASIVPY